MMCVCLCVSARLCLSALCACVLGRVTLLCVIKNMCAVISLCDVTMCVYLCALSRLLCVIMRARVYRFVGCSRCVVLCALLVVVVFALCDDVCVLVCWLRIVCAHRFCYLICGSIHRYVFMRLRMRVGFSLRCYVMTSLYLTVCARLVFLIGCVIVCLCFCIHYLLCVNV